MAEIELKYYAGKKECIDLIYIPDTWNKLSKRQLLYIANYWESWKLMTQNNVSLLRAKALLFVQLMEGNTRFNLKARIDRIVSLKNEELFDLTQLTNFVFTENTLTICPMPMLRFGLFTKLYAPNDKLGNIKAEEFHFADMFFLQYFNFGNEQSLDNLIGTLYRPKKNGSRVAFNYEHISKYAKLAQKLSYAEKQLILLWYMGCRAHLVKKNEDLFTTGNEESAKSNGWLPIIMALSGDKFGSFNETKQTDFVLILMEIRESKERTQKK